MGRAGAGSAGGHHASGGGHSSSRSGGGHHVGGSGHSRAGSGTYHSSSRSYDRGPRRDSYYDGPGRRGYGGPGYYGGPGMPPPPPPRRTRYYNNGGSRRSGLGTAIGTLVVFFVIMIIAFVLMSSGGGIPTGAKSTIQREKLETKNAYMNNCIEDEIGWFDNKQSTSKGLKKFWDETGVQPYIILKAYDPALTTDEQKEQWAKDYYENNFDTENIFLYVYYAEPDANNAVGYMTYTNGYETSSVMDAEAVDIFWNNIDKYWYSNMTTDDLFVAAFSDTSKTIMRVSTTGKDIMKWVLVVTAIVIAGLVILSLVQKKNERDKEKAAEDERILNTPVQDIAKDNLEDKYL